MTGYLFVALAVFVAVAGWRIRNRPDSRYSSWIGPVMVSRQERQIVQS